MELSRPSLTNLLVILAGIFPRSGAGRLLSVLLLGGLSGAFASEAYAQTLISICDRTDPVETAILAAIPGSVACDEVTNQQLAAITTLDLHRKSLMALQGSDFAGLDNLEELDLNSNGLTSLPEDVFNGLTNLGILDLGFNGLTSLPEDVFDGLTSLEILNLGGNGLTSLPEDMFDGLDNLEELYLDSNDLMSLPEDVFNGLTSLEILDLGFNGLTSLPEDVFDGPTSLGFLSLDSNSLTSLPEDMFNGLTNLEFLQLDNNDFLTSLPEDVFDGLINLEFLDLGFNSITDLTPLSNLTALGTLGLNSNGISDIAPLVANSGLGSGDTIDLRGNTLNAVAYSTHIPALQDREVRVQFDPPDITGVTVSICDRTDPVETAILAAIPGSVACDEVTNQQLAAITTLDLHRKSLMALQGSDFAGLTNLEFLDLNTNGLTSLPEDVFNGLTNLEILDLDSNGLTSLPEDVFNGLTNLEILNLGFNGLTSLPEDVFNGLTNLEILNLGFNGLMTLPEHMFDGLTNLESLDLNSNGLMSLPEDVFDSLTNLEFLGLNLNSITDLTPLSDLTALRTLGLHSNSISDIAPLVANSGLGSGDTIDLRGNADTLNAAAYSTHIPALQDRGVTVQFAPADIAGVTVFPTVLTVNEAGTTETYTVVLNSQPTADVTVIPTSEDETVATVSGPLTFTPQNWRTPQEVTVTGVNDNALNDPPRSTQVTHTVSGGDYNGMTVENVSITAVDVVAISIHAVESSVTEGTPVQFRLTATPAPIDDLVVAITIADPDSVLMEAAPTAVAIEANQSTFILELATDDDQIDELNATVTITLEETPEPDYTVAAAPDNSASVTVMDNDGLTRERREQGIKHALGAFGRAAGWDLVETIRNRSRNSAVQAKAFEISNLPAFGTTNPNAAGSSIKLSSIDLSKLLETEIRITFNPQVAQASESESSNKSPIVRAWIQASRTDVDSNPFEGRTQEGEVIIGRLGVDAAYTSGWLIGSAFSWHDGNIEFDDSTFTTTGGVGVDLLSINPYVSFTKGKLHLWGTIGGGIGDLHYEDSPTETPPTATSSDLRMLTVAAGAEYEFGHLGPFDLKGRGESMIVDLDAEGSSHPLIGYDEVGVTVYGTRGEFELGLPLHFDDNRTEFRPYVFTGLRQDGGLDSDLALEYGGGFALRTRSLVAEGTIRSQTGRENDAVSLKGYSISLAYDRDNDRKGLVARFEESAGPSSDYDPYGGGAFSSFSPSAAGTATRFHLGYGIGWDEQLLRPFVEMDWQESQQSDLDLGLEYQYADGSANLSYSDGELNLRFRFRKLF